MNAPETSRRQAVIPLAVLGVAALAIVLFLVFSGGDEEPAAQPTASPTTAGPKPTTAEVKGSGSAPDSIAISKASVARGTTAIGLAIDVPDLAIDDLDRITVVVRQRDTTWRLSTSKDPRDAFVSPRLEREVTENFQVKRTEYACAKGTIRAGDSRLSVTLPLACLDRSAAPVRVSVSLAGRDGASERTGRTKPLAAPKS